jgi:threonyl-tRNA synthetase
VSKKINQILFFDAVRGPRGGRGLESQKNHDEVQAMRHSLAHIMAAAVKQLWPKTKFGVGPVIENGFYYDVDVDQSLTPEDLERIEAMMGEIVKADHPFEAFELGIDEAIKKVKSEGQNYKVELLEDLKKHGTTVAKDIDHTGLGLGDNEDKITTVSFYRSGEFEDLCRGPHVESTGKVGAFKLTKVSGAYWRGDQKNPQMQRIYGVGFTTQKELEKHLQMQEEAKKRDHRLIGEHLDLFALSQEVGQGLILWLPKGTIIKEVIESFAKKTEAEYGYQRVSTPHIAREELFYTSGHLPYYKDDMYPPMTMDNEKYYLKPMNCPHMHMVYKARQHSYRDLPLRYAEFGTVYRNEDSGTLMGLMRVRGMTQNDAHIYCTEEQAVEELVSVIKLHQYYYDLFGIEDYHVELALPDFSKKADKYFDDPEGWETAVGLLREAAKKSGINVVEKEGEAAFYGPKFDFNIKSVTGREFGASTNQLDFGSGKRFGLMYADSDGTEKPVPYVIHRAPLGSDERFIGFLIEHYAGAFPVWLAPEQVRLATVNDQETVINYARKLERQILESGLRVGLDDSNESVGKKIRAAELMKVPYTIVVGEKEVESGMVAPRLRKDWGGEIKPVAIEKFLQTVADEVDSRAAKTHLRQN